MAELNYKNFPDDIKKAIRIRAAQEGMTERELVTSTLAKLVGVSYQDNKDVKAK